MYISMCVYQISAKYGSINGYALVCKCMCFHVCTRRRRVNAHVHMQVFISANVHVCTYMHT